MPRFLSTICQRAGRKSAMLGITRRIDTGPDLQTTPDPVTGRIRQISATERTKREAEAALTWLLGEVATGVHAGPDVTMGGLLDRWYALAAPDWSPKNAVETRRARCPQELTSLPT